VVNTHPWGDPALHQCAVRELDRVRAINADLLAVVDRLVNDDDIAQGFGGLYAHLSKLREMARPVLAKAKGGAP